MKTTKTQSMGRLTRLFYLGFFALSFLVTRPSAGVPPPDPRHSIWRYTGVPFQWEKLANDAWTSSIAASGGELFRLIRQDYYYQFRSASIARYTGTPCAGDACRGWELLDNNRKTIQIASGLGRLYQLQETGEIWQYTNTPCNGNICPGWVRLDNNPATRRIFVGIDTGQLYQMHANGWVWKYTGPPCNGDFCPGWQLLDANPGTSTLAADRLTVYQMHYWPPPTSTWDPDDASVWAYTGPPCSSSTFCPGWVALDKNRATRQIAAANGLLYKRNVDGSIWLYNGPACTGTVCPGWQPLDNNPSTVSITASPPAFLYQQHRDGAIWQWLGFPCNQGICPSWQQIGAFRSAAVQLVSDGAQLYQFRDDNPYRAP